MDIFSDTYIYGTGSNLHHAYVLEGEREVVREKLLKFIGTKLGLEIQGNPDVWHEKYETFSIDDARSLRETQSLRALAGDRKIFILEVFSITVEAQNSLLKVFEEPTQGTHFFIITPTSEVFLPTLKSRVAIIRPSGSKAEKNRNADAEIFLRQSVSERLKSVAEIAEEKDKAKAVDIVNGLIHALHGKTDSFVMNELLSVRSYLSDRSPSIKLLLEHIALMI